MGLLTSFNTQPILPLKLLRPPRRAYTTITELSQMTLLNSISDGLEHGWVQRFHEQCTVLQSHVQQQQG